MAALFGEPHSGRSFHDSFGHLFPNYRWYRQPLAYAWRYALMSFFPIRRIKRLLRGQKSPMELGREWTKFESVDNPQGECPNCFGTEFLEGPSGGMSVNVECVKCGCRWNASPYPMSWEFIGRNDEFRAMVRRARVAGGAEE